MATATQKLWEVEEPRIVHHGIGRGGRKFYRVKYFRKLQAGGEIGGVVSVWATRPRVAALAIATAVNPDKLQSTVIPEGD